MNPVNNGNSDALTVEKYLTSRQQELTLQLKSIDESDPIMINIPETIESGTEAWEADAHIKSLATKRHILTQLTQIQDTLLRIRNGTYGKCIKCGNNIEHDRLKAMPVAALCLSCINK